MNKIQNCIDLSMSKSDLELLKENCYSTKLSRDVKINKLRDIGRKMPFGKYKGESVLWLLVKHWRYMQWICDNTKFKLNDTEIWFNTYLDEQDHLQYVDNILYGLNQVASKDGIIDNFPETNPHYIVE